jgi:hypothetical protein
MPGFNGTGPMGQGACTGRGRGRCGGQGLGAGGGPMGGGQRRLRMRNGKGGMPQAEASLPDGASSGSSQRSGPLASGQEVAGLKQQVQQLTQTVRALTQKLNVPQPPASSEA